jgi:thioredoxin reductase (NADPH)
VSFNALIVGAGMAGCSAALWLNDLAVPFRWIEPENRIGGVLHRVHAPIPNYAAVKAPVGGEDIVRQLQSHLSSFQLEPEQGRLLSLVPRDEAPGLTVHLRQEEGGIEFDAVILCTGTTPRTLEAINDSAQNKVSFSSMKIRSRVAGQRVLIIGGGDGAFEGATELASADARVVVIHRSDDYRARPEFQEKVSSLEAVELRSHTELSSLKPAGNSLLAELSGPDASYTENFDWCVVKIGVKPQIPDIAGIARESGYLKVDQWQQTSIDRFPCGQIAPFPDA